MRRLAWALPLLLAGCARDPLMCQDYRRPYLFLGECVQGSEAAGTILGVLVSVAFAAWLTWVFVGIRAEAKRAADEAAATRALVVDLLAETKLSNENLSEGFARIIAPDED